VRQRSPGVAQSAHTRLGYPYESSGKGTDKKGQYEPLDEVCNLSWQAAFVRGHFSSIRTAECLPLNQTHTIIAHGHHEMHGVAGAWERRGRLGQSSADDRQEGVHLSPGVEYMVVPTAGREEYWLSDGQSRFERVRTLPMSLQHVSVLRFWEILPIDNSGIGGQKR
jgi:hypothetical protein